MRFNVASCRFLESSPRTDCLPSQHFHVSLAATRSYSAAAWLVTDSRVVLNCLLVCPKALDCFTLTLAFVSCPRTKKEFHFHVSFAATRSYSVAAWLATGSRVAQPPRGSLLAAALRVPGALLLTGVGNWLPRVAIAMARLAPGSPLSCS